MGKVGAIEASTIAEFLRLSSLDESEIKRRASVLSRDINEIGFKTFHLSAQNYPYPDPSTGKITSKPLGEYYFGDTGFSVHQATNPFDDFPTWFGGPGLDRGHLQFFSKVSDIAHKVIPHLWLRSPRLRASLRNPSQHIDTLEEIWSLARWQGLKPDGIRMAQELSPNSASDVDWQIDLAGNGMTVNLEVKRLKFDVVRIREGRQFDAHRFAQFCASDVLPKFRASMDREVNVLALTIFGEVNAQVNGVISDWLKSEPRVIDAILVTAHHPLGGGLFYLHFGNQKASDLQGELTSLDAEDRDMWFPIEFTYHIPGFPFRR